MSVHFQLRRSITRSVSRLTGAPNQSARVTLTIAIAVLPTETIAA